MMHSTRKQHGFTLIELLLTLSIMAILAALTIPLFGDNNAFCLNSAQRLLVSDLEYTQIIAITNPDKAIGLVINSDSDGWHIASLDTPKVPLDDPITEDPLVVKFGSGTAAYISDVLIETNATNNIIAFDAGGGLKNTLTDATLTLNINDEELVVTVDSITGTID